MQKTNHRFFQYSLALLIAVQLHGTTALAQNTGLADNFRLIDGSSSWQLLEKIPLQFDTYHPQGLVRVGEAFFLSSVETTSAPQIYSGAEENSAYDRTPGAGVGHLFKFDSEGRLLDHITLGEGSQYYPGGIDFDGEVIWISVAQYRPNSHSIVYRVDPDDLSVEEVFRFDDHLGAIVHDRQGQTLHAVSWGSELYYSWPKTENSYVADEFRSARKQGSEIEYQDCQIVTPGSMLCSGIGDFSIDNTHTFTVGGIELVDLASKKIQHRITVTLTADSGEFLVRNPSFFEYSEARRSVFYFVPEDEHSNLYKYEITSNP